MHEIERVAEESTSEREDRQRAHRGDKQAKPSPSQLCQSLTSQPVRMLHVYIGP